MSQVIRDTKNRSLCQFFVCKYRGWATRLLNLKCLPKPCKYNGNNALSPSVDYCKNAAAFSVPEVSTNSGAIFGCALTFIRCLKVPKR